jgi:hypothetical protein
MASPTRSSIELGLAAALALLALACERTSAAQPVPEPAEATDAPAQADAAQRVAELEAEVARLRAQLGAAAPEANCAELESEVASLRTELGQLEERRVEREQQWQRYMDTLRSFELPAMPVDFRADVPDQQGPPVPPPVVVEDKLAVRSAEIARSLRTLLAIEGVRGIDLFEAGRLHDDPGGGWIGPVVFRTLDERGRLAGSLCAERLRLEGSRAARSLTIVLEEGFESRSGERTQFPPDEAAKAQMQPVGVRRFVLSGIDPMQWVSAVPELFGNAQLDRPTDDGLWNSDYVRGTLNRLLRLDAAHGYWRIKTLGGVADGVLRDVHLEGFDKSGKLERRAFADRFSVVAQERGVMLLFEEGALERGDERAPFLDGRFRVFLPRADLAEWRKAGIPGLSPPPRASEPEHPSAASH